MWRGSTGVKRCSVALTSAATSAPVQNLSPSWVVSLSVATSFHTTSVGGTVSRLYMCKSVVVSGQTACIFVCSTNRSITVLWNDKPAQSDQGDTRQPSDRQSLPDTGRLKGQRPQPLLQPQVSMCVDLRLHIDPPVYGRFTERRFPIRGFPDKRFPGQSLLWKDVSRKIIFPEK